MAPDAEREEPRDLLLAIDHLVREELARDPERVGVGLHGPSLHDLGSSVYIK
jgi:hypothetical protein